LTPFQKKIAVLDMVPNFQDQEPWLERSKTRPRLCVARPRH